MSNEIFATHNLNSVRTVCDEYREILNSVPSAERISDPKWEENNSWEKDTRGLASLHSYVYDRTNKA
jgi:hypothetical protein